MSPNPSGTNPSESAWPACMVELSRDEALTLLGSVQLGRVAFTDQALPAIRPVNRFVDTGDIIVRTRGGSALLGRARSPRWWRTRPTRSTRRR
jgi:hypothetical protein